MAYIPDYLDQQLTHELKHFEVTLQCDKCRAGTFSPAGDITPEAQAEGDLLHVCSHCERELVVKGSAYPRTQTIRTLTSQVTVKNPGPVPDPNAPPAKLTAWEISEMSMADRAVLIRATSDPDVVELFRAMSQEVLFAPAYSEIKNALYEMAAQVARHRSVTEPAPASDLTVSEVDGLTIVQMEKLLLTTHSTEVVAQIKNNTQYRLMRLPEIRKALFDLAVIAAPLRAVGLAPVD